VLYVDRDFQRIDEALLAPVTKALAPIANITVESQVLYHTPKSSFSSWDKKLQSYIFRTSDLPFFVRTVFSQSPRLIWIELII
jgi:phosphatidylinositol glycan class S